MKSNSILRLLAAAGAAALLLTSFAGCHTAEGLGEDIQQTGRAIKREAHRAHH